jgi:glycosyltransferase involved in cell wall biosynthesis
VPIPNGIDIARFINSAELEFKLPQSFAGRKILLNIGAFEYKKGHDVLLHAFADVRRLHPNTCLILAGQTAAKLTETERLVAELGLCDDVLLLRDIPHSRIASLLQSADLFVLSSRWKKGVCGEGFAMALLEAGAAGKPVVSTDSCGVAELVTKGASGWVVPTERPDLLAQAIGRALSNPEESARYGHNLHATVRRWFTWENTHLRYLEMLGRSARETPSDSPAIAA